MTSDEMVRVKRQERDYFDEALDELKKRADASGLIVDAVATSALNSTLHQALIEAEQAEGPSFHSARHETEFDRTKVIFADEATKAALQDHAAVVGSQHIERAAEKTRRNNNWPFIWRRQ